MFDGWKTLEWACGGGWVGLLHEKASKVCLMGGRPWSGRAVKDVLAHRMGRRARCAYGWKALKWECGVRRVGLLHKKASKVCLWVEGHGVEVRCRMGWPIEWEGEQGAFMGGRPWSGSAV